MLAWPSLQECDTWWFHLLELDEENESVWRRSAQGEEGEAGMVEGRERARG